MAAAHPPAHTAYATSPIIELLLFRTVPERNRQQPWRLSDLDSSPEFFSPNPQSSNRNPTRPSRCRRLPDIDSPARTVPGDNERRKNQDLRMAPASMCASMPASPSSPRKLR